MKLNRFHKQSGASLMEVLIAMTISLVVTAAMIAMMSNSLGTTARIIKMTKLTDDMRVAMQMMTRDVRRSSYNAGSQLCYANDDCGTDTSELDGVSLTLAGDIYFNDDNTCFTFHTDRNHDGNTTGDAVGGFRQVTKPNRALKSVGVIQMWTGDEAETPDCGENPLSAESKWVDITDLENMDIYAFTVDDDLSYNQLILDNGVDTLSQRIRKVHMDMRGQLVMDNDIKRRVEDVIDIRNDLLL